MKKLGFGFMRLPVINDDYFNVDIKRVKCLVDTFMEGGFCYFDLAYTYHGDMSEKTFKECVSNVYPRQQYVVADKMPLWEIENENQYEEIFNEQLLRCGVSYFDYYLLHSLGSTTYPRAKQTNAFAFLNQLKKDGRAKHIGFSFHDNAEKLEQILCEHPEIDVVQLQINYLDWNSIDIESKKCYEACLKYNKKIIVMEGLKGGVLATPPQKAADLMLDYNKLASFASWGFRFAASLENVIMVLSGMNDLHQIYDNMKTFSPFIPINKEELKILEATTKIFQETNEIPCTCCNYCFKCPKGIPVSKYFSLYNDHVKFGPSGSTFLTYENLKASEPVVAECIGCGLCEKLCPQHLPIINTLKNVENTFLKFLD